MTMAMCFYDYGVNKVYEAVDLKSHRKMFLKSSKNK